MFSKKNPSDGKFSGKVIKKSTSKDSTHNRTKISENNSVDHKKKISGLNTVNSMVTMRNSLPISGTQNDARTKFTSKIKDTNLSINVLSFSQNKDNL